VPSETKESGSRQTASRAKQTLWFFIATLAAMSMWTYVDRILVVHQVIDASANDRPRGNLSDLYPRWLGARELLLHHRNPYSDEITLEIQKGYYGRPIDPSRPNDPKDRQSFAYPVYVVFLLAPSIWLPFHTVQLLFYWLLITLTAASVLLWLRALCWSLSIPTIAICMALTLGSFQTVQGIKLQQLSLLVAAFLAAASACITAGFFVSGGLLLALATIKPQIAWPIVVWIMFWVFSNWPKRRRLVYAFATVMALLLVGAEIVLPGWWRMFAQAIQDYGRYTQNRSVLDVLAPWSFAGKILAVAAAIACLWPLWKFRKQSADTRQFGMAITLIMALTVLIVPMYAPYNQVLLIPAILALTRDRSVLFSRSRSTRFVYMAGALALFWQWFASMMLCAILSVSQSLALKGWQWPYFATFTIPVLIFALVFIDVSAEPAALTPS
jgi:hypothetical protein